MTNTETLTRRVAVYARRSKLTNSKTESKSVADQIEACRRLAQDRGWGDIPQDAIFKDDGVSAWRNQGRMRRDGLEALLLSLKANQFDTVIVWERSRLQRNMFEGIDIMRKFYDAGADLISVSEQWIDTTSAMGRGLYALMISMDEAEAEKISKRIKRGKAALTEAGVAPTTGKRMFGYTPKFEAHPTEWVIGRRIVDAVLAGVSLTALCHDLQAEGVTSTGGKPFSVATLRHWLRSEMLAGTRQGFQGQWPALITAEEHEALLARNGGETGQPYADRTIYLLSGMLHCSKCGCTMHVRNRGKYVCEKGPGLPGCGGTTITMTLADAEVTSQLLTMLTHTHLRAVIGQHDADVIRAKIEADESALAELGSARYVARTITDDIFLPASREIQARLDSERELLAVANSSLSNLPPVGNRKALDEWWAVASVEERRAALRYFVKSIVVRPGKRGTFDPTRILLNPDLTHLSHIPLDDRPYGSQSKADQI